MGVCLSRRVSFAQEVDVIKSSPLLFSPAEELESLTTPTVMDMGSVKRSDIQVAQLTYALFRSDDAYDVSDGISTPQFPYLSAPPGFTPIAKPGDILRGRLDPPHSMMHRRHFPDGTPRRLRDTIMTCWDYHSQFLQLIGYLQWIQWNAFLHLLWWRRTIRMGMQDCWHRYLVLHQSARCRGRPCRRTSPSTMLSTVRPDYLRPGLRTLFHVGVWLRRAHFCLSFLIRVLAGFGRGCAFRNTIHTGSQTSLNPPGSMGCRCTTPGFWNGSALRRRLDYWIKVLVLGCTRWMSREQAIDTARQLQRDVSHEVELGTFQTNTCCAFRARQLKFWSQSWVPGTFRLWRWLRAPWFPGFVGLPFIMEAMGLW